MESIVQKTDEVKVFKFEPDLPISELASAGEQQHASKLVSRVQQHHAKQISALVKQRYAECSKVISSGLLFEFGNEIKLNWMREQYFKIVEEVLDASSTKPDGSDSVTNAVSAKVTSPCRDANSDALKRPLGGDMFASPRPKKKRKEARADSS